MSATFNQLKMEAEGALARHEWASVLSSASQMRATGEDNEYSDSLIRISVVQLTPQQEDRTDELLAVLNRIAGNTSGLYWGLIGVGIVGWAFAIWSWVD
jgi:hypothetical protein